MMYNQELLESSFLSWIFSWKWNDLYMKLYQIRYEQKVKVLVNIDFWIDFGANVAPISVQKSIKLIKQDDTICETILDLLLKNLKQK